jgi:cell division protein FtsI/penicillin-binding protein 2
MAIGRGLRVPHNIASLVAWDTVKVLFTATASTTGNPTEINFAFNLAMHPQYTSWQTLFDQYTIPQASLTIESQYPSGSTSLPITVYTALDFDNITPLNTISAIEDYSTCREQVLGVGTKVVRSVRPTIKNTVQNSSGSSMAGLSQSWIDCAQSTVQFFGIRVMLSQEAALNVKVTATVWYAFRNQI